MQSLDTTAPKSLVATLIPYVVLLLVILVLIPIILQIRQIILRKSVMKEFGVTIPSKIHITQGEEQQIGTFQLIYPVWSYAKRDGTQDHRHSVNKALKDKSSINIGHYILTCNDPFLMYSIVKKLRTAGASIEYSSQELQKRQLIVNRLRIRQLSSSIDAIISHFLSNPNGFEDFCADLFRQYGYRVQVMPPARRRDFNLILVKDGVKSIGECKCFSQSHHIGRPVLQKLIGANATQYAQEMLVITTSSFTADAKKFGAESNIELIGGDRLVRMCQTVWGDHPTAQAIPSESIELSHQEQLANIPSDMRDLYR